MQLGSVTIKKGKKKIITTLKVFVDGIEQYSWVQSMYMDGTTYEIH